VASRDAEFPSFLRPDRERQTKKRRRENGTEEENEEQRKRRKKGKGSGLEGVREETHVVSCAQRSLSPSYSILLSTILSLLSTTASKACGGILSEPKIRSICLFDCLLTTYEN